MTRSRRALSAAADRTEVWVGTDSAAELQVDALTALCEAAFGKVDNIRVIAPISGGHKPFAWVRFAHSDAALAAVAAESLEYGEVTMSIRPTWLAEGQVSITIEDAVSMLRSLPMQSGRYAALRDMAEARLGRALLRNEKTILTNALRAEHDETSDNLQRLDAPSVLVMMAYSVDYEAGHLCEQANRAWALAQGFGFTCHLMEASEMNAFIAPRSNLTWYKILMIHRQLSETASSAQNVSHQWLFWIDADAVVISTKSCLIQDLIYQHRDKHLIIGEDLTLASFINAGVMLIRVSAWSRKLFAELWDSSWCKRYYHVRQYDQSALQRWLTKAGEFDEWLCCAENSGYSRDVHIGSAQKDGENNSRGSEPGSPSASNIAPSGFALSGSMSDAFNASCDREPVSPRFDGEESATIHEFSGKPFHSFNGGESTKLSAHCVFLPRYKFNSNILSEAQFIFHAVGVSKAASVQKALGRHGVQLASSEANLSDRSQIASKMHLHSCEDT